jgi:hypothetical protein
MTKRLFVAALAVLLWTPYAAGQSILQRSDWKERGLETYLPPSGPTVPWLDLNTRTKWPKGDLPRGRDAASTGQFVLPSAATETRLSSDASSTPRSM